MINMDAAFKNNAYRILEQFIRFPTKEFSGRGIARSLNLSHGTVLKHISELERLDMVRKKDTTLYPTFYANTENQKYRFYKKNWLVFKIKESGIIEYIQEKTLSSSIVLFGSGAKGTFSEGSDIDIFVEAQDSGLATEKYEKKLNRTINILFESDVNNLSRELCNNIINGIVLYGYIKLGKEDGK